MIKLKKLNSLGFSHLLVPLLAIGLLAACGSYILMRSKAATVTTYQNGKLGFGVSTINLDGSGYLNTPVAGNRTWEALSPDGTKVAYQEHVAVSDYNSQFKLSVVKVGETSAQNIMTFNLPVGNTYNVLQWSPDGQWLMIGYDASPSNVNSKGGRKGVWIVKPDGTQGHNGPVFGYYEGGAVTWMPDSQSLLYTKHDLDQNGRSYTKELCKVAASGNTDIATCAQMDGDRKSVWNLGSFQVSNDGRLVLFRTLEADNSMNAYIVNINGTGLVNLTNKTGGQQVTEAVISPDNKLVAYTAYENESDIYPSTVNVDGTSKVTLTAVNNTVGAARLSGWQRISTSLTYLAKCDISLPISGVKTFAAQKSTVTFTGIGTGKATLSDIKVKTTDRGGRVLSQSNIAGFSIAPQQTIKKELQGGRKFSSSQTVTVSGKTNSGTAFSCTNATR